MALARAQSSRQCEPPGDRESVGIAKFGPAAPEAALAMRIDSFAAHTIGWLKSSYRVPIIAFSRYDGILESRKNVKVA